MVQYSRPPAYNLVVTQTTGGTVADIPNTGVTVITSTVAERYVLAPPTAGCLKTIVAGGTPAGTTGRITIELSTVSSGDSITLMHTTGGATATEIFIETTAQSRVELLGLSATQWLLLGSNLCAAASTGIVFQAS